MPLALPALPAEGRQNSQIQVTRGALKDQARAVPSLDFHGAVLS
jgi:hypothetical protein